MRDPAARRRPPGAAARALLLALAAVALSGCRGDTPVYTTRFLAFGSLADLSIVGVPRDQAERAGKRIERDFRFMHQTWHPWTSTAMIRVNRLLPTGEPFAAPPSILPLVHLAKDYAERSGGLFDPAIGAVKELWGFDVDSPECGPPPPAAEIRRLVDAAPSMSDVHAEGIRLRGANPTVRLDFGPLAKGYGIDVAIAHLRELGIQHALLNAGGDLRAIGDRDGQPWRIAVRRPSGGVLGVIELRGDESLFTTGDWERNFIHDGRTYHDIIDPRTGWPAEETRSVTVVDRDAATAAAAASALFVAGPRGWQQVARDLGVGHVLLLDRSGRVHMNPAMAERIELMDDGLAVEIGPPLAEGGGAG